MSKLKTTDDIDYEDCDIEYDTPVDEACEMTLEYLKKEAIKLIGNLQYKDTIYPILLENFPNNMKGELAKDLWNNTTFKYGSEYGMIAVLLYLFNITEEDLK